MDDIERPVIEARYSPASGATLVVATAVMLTGLVAVVSATASIDASWLNAPLWRSIAGRQAIFVLSGLALMGFTARFAGALLDDPTPRRWACWALLACALVGLLAVMVPGLADARHGSHRWLRLGPASTGLGFQPSELCKLALVLFLAWLLADRSTHPTSFRAGFLPAAVTIGVCVLLVGKEDFGSAALLAMVGVGMLVVAGCRARHLLLIAGAGGCALAGLLVAAPYRLARISAFLNLGDAPRGAGYQPLQSLVTIASGGWLGTGIGAGVQKYGYLPESHSDFIFAVLCEETGVLGGGLLIALYCAFVAIGLRITWTARSSFERLAAFGITVLVGLQAAMNIAVVTVVAPTTGISLPMVSAGGSGLLTMSLAIGLLAAIGKRCVVPDASFNSTLPRSLAGSATEDRPW